MSSPEEKWDHLATECPWRRFICKTILQEEETRCIVIPNREGVARECNIDICAPWHFISGVIAVE